jgi:hypothetical protein
MFAEIRRGLYGCRYFRQERGQILIYALIIMAIGSMIISGTLKFAGSALKQGSVSEDRTAHLYNADAGIESAWQNIRLGSPDLPASVGADPMSYSITLYGLTSHVTIALNEDNQFVYKTYAVTSASTSASGKTTTITATLTAIVGPYYYFLDNSFTTAKNIDFKNKIAVNGFVQTGTHTGKVPIWGSGYGWRPGGSASVWPTAYDLITHYSGDIPPGANYHNGNWSPSGMVDLTASQYVNGNFSLSGGTLKLNGHTVFVDGNIDIKNTIINPAGTASGCIVATGNIKFWPNLDTGDANNGVFIFSLGTAGAEFQPGNNFYGWIAAQNNIEVKSGNNPSYNWVVPPETLDFPGSNGTGGPGVPCGAVQILTWRVH